MQEIDVRNQDLFYMNPPDKYNDYVRKKKGTLRLDPIIIMKPSSSAWKDIIVPRTYIIIDGHDRSYFDSVDNRRSKALELKKDDDITKILSRLHPDHIINLINITTLQNLEDALLEDVKSTIELNKRLPYYVERCIFHYGNNVD